MYKRVRQFLILALLALVVIQFISIDKSNPDFDKANDFIEVTNTPFAIATKLKSACYDCHSNHSEYPWYTNIAAFSFWIKGHIDHNPDHPQCECSAKQEDCKSSGVN